MGPKQRNSKFLLLNVQDFLQKKIVKLKWLNLFKLQNQSFDEFWGQNLRKFVYIPAKSRFPFILTGFFQFLPKFTRIVEFTFTHPSK